LNTTKIGFRYYPDMDHYTQRDLDTWVPELRALGAEVLLLHARPDMAVPEHFLSTLLNEGIRPVIHIPVSMSSITPEVVDPLLSSYSRWGITEVILGDRPNMRYAWETSEWSRTHLIQRFVDRMLPLLEAQFRHGLTPILPPLEPGGDYWDTAFLEDVLLALRERSEPNILQELNLAVHAWTYGKRLDYGAGGRKQWPQSLPYHTPAGSEDQRGFCIADWYQEIAEAVLGKPIQLMACRGGARMSTFSGLDAEQAHSKANTAIYRLLASDGVRGMTMFAFDHLASAAHCPTHMDAWYQREGEKREVVTAIRSLVQSSSKTRSKQLPADESRHVAFLPDEDSIITADILAEAATFLAVEKPCIVFDLKSIGDCNRLTVLSEKRLPQHLREQVRSTNDDVSWFDRTTIPALNAAAHASLAARQESS